MPHIIASLLENKKGLLIKQNIKNLKADKRLVLEKKQYFIGKVLLNDISKAIDAKEQKIYFVTFKNSAKTKLHYHESGQVLVVTEGRGILVIYASKPIAKGITYKIKKVKEVLLAKGDVAYIPKNTMHWHGALNKYKFSHIAINSYTPLGKEAKTIWFDSDFLNIAKRIK